jgi:hypothetical protein
MNSYRDEHVSVHLSCGGLRRARFDNALLRIAKARETIGVWLVVVGLGVFIGWSAAQGVAS